jgi:hypothetical protein
MKQITPDRSMKRKELCFALLLLLVSGNPVFSNSLLSPFILIPLTLYLLIFYSKIENSVFIDRFIFIGAGFLFIYLAHIIKFQVYAIFTYLFFFLKMFAGGLAIHKVGPRFSERLFSVVFVISFISLICYGALLVVGSDVMPGFESPYLLGPNVKSMLIFTTHMSDQWWRNSSMFWEPGAFQAMINLSLTLLPVSAWFERGRRLRMICVLLALVTTFSTTGYLLFFLISTLKLFQLNKSWITRVLLIAFTLAIALIATFELDFLGEKIVGQYERSSYAASFSPDRFGSLFFDMHYIEKNPVFGNGLTEKTRLADHSELHGLHLGHSNGLSNFVANFGFFGAIIYFFGLATGRTGVARGDRLILVIVVAVIAFSEQFLGYALFLGLPFLRLTDLRSASTRRPAGATSP